MVETELIYEEFAETLIHFLFKRVNKNFIKKIFFN